MDDRLYQSKKHEHRSAQTAHGGVRQASISLDRVVSDPEVVSLIEGARRMMEALRYTDHSARHTHLIAKRAGMILQTLGYPERDVELARVAGYLHDIGNAMSRPGHERIGAILGYDILKRLGATYDDAMLVATAIANHDEGGGSPVNDIAAAVIISDKSDVHRSRVRNHGALASFDIHDRVNYAVTESDVVVDPLAETCHIVLTVDTAISSVSDYFEIFLSRMLMCRHAAEFLGLTFNLIVNNVAIM